MDVQGGQEDEKCKVEAKAEVNGRKKKRKKKKYKQRKREKWWCCFLVRPWKISGGKKQVEDENDNKEKEI